MADVFALGEGQALSPRSSTRAFTLLEVLICMAITLVVTTPLFQTFRTLHLAYTSTLERADLRSEAQRAKAALQTALADSPKLKLDSDNRGLTWGEGSRVTWNGEDLFLTESGKQRLLLEKVQQAAFFTRDGRLYLSLKVGFEPRGLSYAAQYVLLDSVP